MDNKQSNYKRWFMERYNATDQQRPEGAAPRPPRGSCRTSDEAWLLGSRDFYEKVNPYWVQQAASDKRQALRRKRQAASRKHLTKNK